MARTKQTARTGNKSRRPRPAIPSFEIRRPNNDDDEMDVFLPHHNDSLSGVDPEGIKKITRFDSEGWGATSAEQHTAFATILTVGYIQDWAKACPLRNILRVAILPGGPDNEVSKNENELTIHVKYEFDFVSSDEFECHDYGIAFDFAKYGRKSLQAMLKKFTNEIEGDWQSELNDAREHLLWRQQATEDRILYLKDKIKELDKASSMAWEK